MSLKIEITYDSEPGWMVIDAPYDVDFIANLKEMIPSKYRRWNPLLKTWRVRVVYLDDVLALASDYFDDIYCDLAARVPLPIENGGPFEVLFLLPSAPNELIKSAYRLLSMRYHPDKGGTTESMTRLNCAYDEIKQLRNIT